MKKRRYLVLRVDDEDVKKIREYLLSQGKTITDGLIDEVNYVIDKKIPIKKPVEDFLNIREKLIAKYGTLKKAAEHVGMNPGMLRNTLHFLETKKNYRPSKSTMSMLSELIGK